MRRANKAILRANHPIPTLDDILSKLAGAKWFSKLDVREAYHQVQLHESCRYITTFVTHRGMYRYTRLMFGMSCASEHFQRIFEQILCGCPSSIIYQDDVLIYGDTKEKHDQALKLVLARLKESNVLLNSAKCIMGVQKIEFLGHELSASGVRPSESKIDAVKRFRNPETAEEVRR